ncbi:NEDD4-binding protein 1 [Drosophila eugracilis]|uniref:NEDD4-binding protein 1 n=1 Tax=Drosophila eugracilis TaxID=29029 RepID=UPI0007E5EB6C|nr:NEDD4-binding protein 1 [Drosophila eugracilis]
MSQTKKNRNRKKTIKAKQKWHKRGLASSKASKILLKLSADDPQKDSDAGPANMIETPETVSSSSRKMSKKPNSSRKHGNPKLQNKILKRQANKKNGLNRELINKCLSSIKKKYKVQRNPQIKRRLEFCEKKSPAKRNALPKPKFYRPQKATEVPIKNQNDTIECGEIVEELVTISDDEDCVLLETPQESINIEDDEDEVDEDNVPSTSSKLSIVQIVEDCNGEVGLRLKQKTENKVLYSTIAKTDSSEPIINLDEIPQAVPSPNADNNDSVIFISGEDFIPIPSFSPTAAKEKKRPPKTNSARMRDSLFTTAEKKKLGDYNTNTFNPSDEAEETSKKPKSNKRSVIIDGSNVAFAHGHSNVFSSEGIKYCLRYFEKMGHDAKVVVPMFRKNTYKSSNPEILDKLHKEGKIVFTPCKNLPGQMSSSYDDRFILQLAYEKNAAVVSNDNYRDLIDENPAFKKIVENRVLGYTWCDDIFILPKDPYGRWGPTLDEILKC